MAIHSSILAWRIPGTEDPGRLQSMGLQRVEHNSPSVSRATNTLVAFPGGTSDKEPACQCRRHKRHGFDSCVKDFLEKRMAIHTSVLALRILWAEEPGGL